MQNEWFESWFNSPLYDLLYEHRDDDEASKFIDRLFVQLSPGQHARMLDLACGAGRHTLHIFSRGYDVIGLDLSEKMIDDAIVKTDGKPAFYQHDMRDVFRVNYFDYIFSFFTSFGYFDRVSDNLKMLKAVQIGLRSKGKFLLDYLNPSYVIANLVEEEKRSVRDWHVDINRSIQDNKVIKQMKWSRGEQVYHYSEKVSLFDLDQLESMFRKADLIIEKLFGNYSLDNYHAKSSDRLIILAGKK
jgi:SAM-dependent methyltransferase